MKMRTQKSSFSYSIFVYSLTACATAQSVKFLDAIPGKQFANCYRLQTCCRDYLADKPGFFYRARSGQNVQLITRLHLVPTSRMRGAQSPFNCI